MWTLMYLSSYSWLFMSYFIMICMTPGGIKIQNIKLNAICLYALVDNKILRPFNEWWPYSDDPNLPGNIGSQNTMAYPPQTNTFWTQSMSTNDECGIIVYEGTFTWNDLVEWYTNIYILISN